MKKTINFFLNLTGEILIFLIWSISLIFFIYLSAIFSFKFLLPNLRIPFNDDILVLTNRQLSIYLVIIFIFVLLAIFIRLRQKLIKMKMIFELPSKEIALFTFTSIFFGHFFAISLSYISSFYLLWLIFYFLFFIFSIPLLNDFYKNSLLHLKKSITINMKEYFAESNLIKVFSTLGLIQKLGLVINLIIYFLFLIILLGGLYLLLNKSVSYIAQQKKLKVSLSINKFSPEKITIGESLTLHGNNFGWRNNPMDRLVSDYGTVNVDTWEEEKIRFLIPLEWKPGKVNLRIIRNKTDNPPFGEYKSNTVELQISSRWDFYPTIEEVESNTMESLISRLIKKVKRKYYLNKD